jgi:hypothetical protein
VMRKELTSMPLQRARTHVVLPAELVSKIDALVGPRGRSRFIAEAAEQRLQQEQLLKALEAGFGAWKEEDHPELSGPEGTAGWVRRLREAEDQRLSEILHE